MPDLDFNLLRKFFSKQPVSQAWLFGSFARGEQTETSDVDILVEFDEGVGLMKYSRIARDLETILKRSVDLVSESSLLPWVRPSVATERILIYER